MDSNHNFNSNNNNNNGNPFWDFVRSFDVNAHAARPGFGVDHADNGPQGFQLPEGFPFHAGGFGPVGPWGGPWDTGHWGGHRGRGGRRGGRGHHGPGHGHGHGHRHHHHDSDGEDTPPEDEPAPDTETMRDTPAQENAENSGATPRHGRHRHHSPHRRASPPPFGPNSGPGPHRRRGGWHSRGGRRGPPYEGPFDFRPLMHALSSHPFAQAYRDYAEQHRSGDAEPQQEGVRDPGMEQHDSFAPPLDVFDTEKTYVIHVSLPGAAREDIGVSWDGEKVIIAGVVHRPGDEEFIRCLASSERKVGMFERSIKLPPAGSSATDDVDGYSMSAKMENGILIVTVPKVEKDNTWTEIHKVDIE